jgi:hypothetical protein
LSLLIALLLVIRISCWCFANGKAILSQAIALVFACMTSFLNFASQTTLTPLCCYG